MDQLTSGRNTKNNSEMPTTIQNYEKDSLALTQNKNDLGVQANPYSINKNRI